MKNISIDQIGAGKTSSLSLRVSTANLAQVFFIDPATKALVMVLERNALYKDNGVIMDLRPFGGSCKLLRADKLYEAIGKFNFDSQENLKNKDFRLFIDPDDWPPLRDFCLNSFRQQDGFMEISVTRELEEEMEEAGINMPPDSYRIQNMGTVVQSEVGEETINSNASGALTKRIFNIVNVQIMNEWAIEEIKNHVANFSVPNMRSRAIQLRKTINSAFMLDFETLLRMVSLRINGEELIIIDGVSYRISTNVPDIVKNEEITKRLDLFICCH